MLPRFREYHRPASVAEALTLLRRPTIRTVPLAGGTTLLCNPDPEIEAVVDLQDLPLGNVQLRDGWLHLGAMLRVQSLVEHPVLRRWAQGLVSRAARESAPLLTRNAATLGGCVASGDSVDPLLLALLALDSVVVLALPERVERPLNSFLDEREGILASGVLITHVLLPPAGGRLGTSLLKVARTPADRPILNGAACLALDEAGCCQKAVVALGGLGPHPVRLHTLEAALTGANLDAKALQKAAAQASLPPDPPTDARASGTYRRKVAPVLLERLLVKAWQQARHNPGQRGGG